MAPLPWPGPWGRLEYGTEQASAFAQGFGDVLSVGKFSDALGALPGGLGPHYEDQTLLPGYQHGRAAGASMAAARIGYAGMAKGLSRALPARQAVAARNGLKKVMSGMFNRHPRVYSYENRLQKYGTDKAVRQAAGRTDWRLNGVALEAVTSEGLQRLPKE